MADRYPLVVFGRLLTCTRCNAHVDLIELPAPWIDASAYQCGPCLKPVVIRCFTDANTTVRIGEPPAPPARRDMSTYDPRTEPIPF